MKYRTVEIHAQETFSSNTTKIIDLNIKQPISSLVVRLNAYAASSTITAHAMACITGIDIIDGSEVLYSLDGYCADALDWYNRGGRFRNNWNIEMNANGWIRYVGLNFGRTEFDTELAFDPGMYNNPQLRITLEPNSGGGNCTNIYVAVYANIFDEKVPSLKGFLMSKEIKQYTMDSGTHEYTDMPLDFPYRAIYIRPFLYGTEPESSLLNFKLSEDQDAKVPFNGSPGDIMSMLNNYPRVSENIICNFPTSATCYMYVTPGGYVTGTASIWDTTVADRRFTCYAGESGRLTVRTNTGAQNGQIHVEGDLPHSVFEIPCGLKDDISDWETWSGVGN